MDDLAAAEELDDAEDIETAMSDLAAQSEEDTGKLAAEEEVEEAEEPEEAEEEETEEPEEAEEEKTEEPEEAEEEETEEPEEAEEEEIEEPEEAEAEEPEEVAEEKVKEPEEAKEPEQKPAKKSVMELDEESQEMVNKLKEKLAGSKKEKQPKSTEKEIYTSFPIPLIPRESLEEVLVEEEHSIVNLSGISFYLWFNEKLLNEEELHALIVEKESQIQKKREQIEYKNQEYLEYIERRSALKNQIVTKEVWQKNQTEQEEIQETMQNLEKEFLDTTEALRISMEHIDQLQTVIQEEKQILLQYARRDTDYVTFCKAYENYQKERKLVEQSRQKKTALQEEKTKALHLQQQYMEQMKSLEHERQRIVDRQNVIKDKLVRYESYELQDATSSNLLPEELEARYDAITTQMSSEFLQAIS